MTASSSFVSSIWPSVAICYSLAICLYLTVPLSVWSSVSLSVAEMSLILPKAKPDKQKRKKNTPWEKQTNSNKKQGICSAVLFHTEPVLGLQDKGELQLSGRCFCDAFSWRGKLQTFGHEIEGVKLQPCRYRCIQLSRDALAGDPL